MVKTNLKFEKRISNKKIIKKTKNYKKTHKLFIFNTKKKKKKLKIKLNLIQYNKWPKKQNLIQKFFSSL